MLNEELLAVNQDTAGRQNGRLRPPALPRPATEGRLEVATAKWKGRGSKDPVSEDTLPSLFPIASLTKYGSTTITDPVPSLTVWCTSKCGSKYRFLQHGYLEEKLLNRVNALTLRQV